MGNRVIGIKKQKYTEGKNAGKTGITYHLAGDFSDYDKNSSNNEISGERVYSEFSYTDFGVKVGDVVDVSYEKGYQDKAMLRDLTPVKVPFEKEKKA